MSWIYLRTNFYQDSYHLQHHIIEIIINHFYFAKWIEFWLVIKVKKVHDKFKAFSTDNILEKTALINWINTPAYLIARQWGKSHGKHYSKTLPHFINGYIFSVHQIRSTTQGARRVYCFSAYLLIFVTNSWINCCQ